MGFMDRIFRRGDRQDERRWWRVEGPPHAQVARAALSIREHTDAQRINAYDTWRDLYVNVPREGVCSSRPIIRNAVDAAFARLSKAKPRPWPVTMDGDNELQERAKAQSIFLDGEYERLEVYKLGGFMLHDSIVMGTGALKVRSSHGRPAIDLVDAADLHVDPREEAYRCVRTLFHVTAMDRDVLLEEFADGDPDAEKAIESSTRYDDKRLRKRMHGAEGISDLVLTFEAWRLPPGPDAEGRHVICTEKGTLLDRPWKRPRFPVLWMNWSRDPQRVWGVGLVERMATGQDELDDLASANRAAFRASAPSIWVSNSANVQRKQITNDTLAVYGFDGNIPPIYMTPSAVGADHVAREQYLRTQLLQDEGISELSAMSQKPAGIESGKGLRTIIDHESQRFLPQSRDYEQLIGVELGVRLLDCADDIVDSDESEADKLVAIGGKRNLEAIRYTDARMDAEASRLRVFPVSSLSQDPAAKIQDCLDLVALGQFTDENGKADPMQIREVLQFPDFDQVQSTAQAKRDVARKKIAKALRGEFVECHSLDDLAFIVDEGVHKHAAAELDGKSLEELELLRSLITQAAGLRMQAMPPPPPMPALPAAPPMPVDPAMAAPPMPIPAGPPALEVV